MPLQAFHFGSPLQNTCCKQIARSGAIRLVREPTRSKFPTGSPGSSRGKRESIYPELCRQCLGTTRPTETGSQRPKANSTALRSAPYGGVATWFSERPNEGCLRRTSGNPRVGQDLSWRERECQDKSWPMFYSNGSSRKANCDRNLKAGLCRSHPSRAEIGCRDAWMDQVQAASGRRAVLLSVARFRSMGGAFWKCT
jgi:hypothetical protein